MLAGLALVLHRCGESTTSSALLKTAVSVVTNPLAVTATAAATLGIDDRSNQDAVRTRGCVCCGRGCVTPHSSRMRTTAVVCGGWIRGSEDGCVRRWPSTAHVRSFPVGVYRFVSLPWPPYEVPAVTPVMTLCRFAACRADDTTNFHNMCQVRLVVGAASNEMRARTHAHDVFWQQLAELCGERAESMATLLEVGLTEERIRAGLVAGGVWGPVEAAVDALLDQPSDDDEAAAQLLSLRERGLQLDKERAKTHKLCPSVRACCCVCLQAGADAGFNFGGHQLPGWAGFDTPDLLPPIGESGLLHNARVFAAQCAHCKLEPVLGTR